MTNGKRDELRVGMDATKGSDNCFGPGVDCPDNRILLLFATPTVLSDFMKLLVGMEALKKSKVSGC